MATTKEIIDDADLAKSYITNSSMSDDYKRIYIRLINTSTLATNGISPEEKILKMTECILLLAVTQGMYLANIDEKIEKAIENANRKQCQDCKAMAHANDIEKEQSDREAFQSYLERLGITELQLLERLKKKQKTEDSSWFSILTSALSKPYLYIALGILFLSPYGIEIVKAIISIWAK